MGYFERDIELETFVYMDQNKRIILSNDGKHYIARILVDEKWKTIRKSISYNQCYLALFPKDKKYKR
jgi:uncharacterized protein YjhX (UPF0386 family)